MPTLAIIAGPNGAGKSTTSQQLLKEMGITAFDFDKELYEKWATFSFDLSIYEGAYDSTNQLYEQLKANALESNNNFAFETNYHTNGILNTVSSFKAKGYAILLVYIFLENIDKAIDRVKNRVAKGGHSVDEETIGERFSKGLTLLDDSFMKYNYVNLFKSVDNDLEPLAYLEPSIGEGRVYRSIPLSLEKELPKLSLYMNDLKKTGLASIQ